MMFSKADPNTKKDQFLEQAKAARQERAVEKHREQAAITIQKIVRGFIARRRLVHTIRKEVDNVLATDCSTEKNLRPSIEVFKVLKKFFTVFHRENDKERFQQVCKYVVSTMDAENVKVCYVAVALLKEYSVQFINQLKLLLWQCCQYLAELRPESPATTKQMLLYLHTLVTFTATKTWKILRLKQNEALVTVMNQLCNNFLNYLVSKGLYETLQVILVKGLARTTPSLKHASLSAIVTLAIRPMSVPQSSENAATLFIIHVLSVPGLLHHTVKISPECLKLFSSLEVFKKCLTQLTTGENARRVFTTLEGSYNLCLLGNLIQLASIEKELLADNLLDFANVLIRLMESCQKYVITKQSNLTHWHPVLGWFAQKIDHGLHESMPYVKTQLQYLWGKPMLDTLFSPLTQTIRRMSTQSDQQQGGSRSYAVGSHQSSAQTSLSKAPGFLRKALEKAASKSASVKFRKMGSTETIMVAVVCSLYQMALGTFTQLRLDILTGLCSEETLLPDLWQLLASLGPCKAFLDHLAMHTKTSSPEFQMLTLFCDWTTHLVTILDDMELYEQQKPFRLEEIVSIAEFLNHFVFRSIWNNLIDLKTLNKDAFFASIHTLLMLLYQRDCRRKYTSDDFWLITEIKSSTFVSDLEKGKKAAQILLHKVPHIISHKERVLLFRKYIADEKTVLGLTESACASPQSTLITVHRARIVEDGYRQLALLPPQVLKGVIRVKFVNEQGLDEAGIDQDGVFKEFLEETIKRVFNPSLNLFKVTSEERLYPSPISHIQENHLQLFEFVGRMLGKAVYEGIVVDVPFATFFLSQVMGHPQNALYSCIDELPSLDPELYKSLTYIKHYDGDVRDLELTFSFDDECMGQVITHELLPGGRAEPVTNENRISYIHLMAHFRMHVQVHDQTIAFTRGFRSIVNAEWLAMFSTPEVQRLVSGDTSEIELEDLRKHTQYYGGFHDNHRVICWLWDILEKDFSPKERSLFLKFVTSCSKPPLLGFAHLEPPFSIRCVEVSDDQDTGDTVGSVLRGFFALHKKDPVFRLPTSSTCFNLLKLPNYQKKSTLREKLRYAINSNTGFELS